MSREPFMRRHEGPRREEWAEMLKTIGVDSIDTLMEETVPEQYYFSDSMPLPRPMEEHVYLGHIREMAKRNRIFRSHIGQGWYGTHLPSVILRNVLENPSWYTSYTPYQAEISQGRLEALLNFQSMVVSLTGLPVANASLLDEGTAAAEAMIMMKNLRSREAVKEGRNILFVDNALFGHVVSVMETRAEWLDIDIVRGDHDTYAFTGKEFGAVIQYPNSKGVIVDYTAFCEKAHAAGVLVAADADLLSLAILREPGAWGADIAFGSTQRFGIPMGYGGPSAAYFAVREEYKRQMPGRIIGISKDRRGNTALRMALQTREQHIKREKATSNICTAQALLATMAGLYAVYHGPEGLRGIAMHAHCGARALDHSLRQMEIPFEKHSYYDTIRITCDDKQKAAIRKSAEKAGFNLWYGEPGVVGVTFDEVTTNESIKALVEAIAEAYGVKAVPIALDGHAIFSDIPAKVSRTSPLLEERVFGLYRSETMMMRYIKQLERKDIALNHSMIPLGSCTMKLNSASSMLPLSWPEFADIHPYAPEDQVEGYTEMIEQVTHFLRVITGFAGVTFQPNSGASGEYAALALLRTYFKHKGEAHRNVVLIPASAHGTNPASAAMAGCKVVVIACDNDGNIVLDDFKAKLEEHKDNLCAMMVTYPSTYGTFDEGVSELIDAIHATGGKVYMDGANMNAQVGLMNPVRLGADLCHLNLHKTFGIPHGGGGPGVGPVCVTEELMPFLPSHCARKTGGEHGLKGVSSGPYGSASILVITYGYMRMLGAEGLREASKVAILNSNYMMARLRGHYNVLFTGSKGRVGHEFILDCHDFRDKYGCESSDIARRLMDYGFHAPTLSFPVHETLMIESTESESKQEMDRFCEALIAIKAEMEEIAAGKADREDNVVRNAPHPADEVIADEWSHPYGREKAAYPLAWLRLNKFWPTVSKVDNGYGDRMLQCTCAPLSDYLE